MAWPTGCDTFVVLPAATEEGWLIFGKNSDRPLGEVQEVVHFPAKTHAKGAKLQCTYVEIPEAEATAAVVLSKPGWMWGAEMGANEFGVVIGNEAVWTKLNGPKDAENRLLGMDLLRLGLERGKTAVEALEVICGLLEERGQGGACAEDDPELLYHNSFLIADAKEAWILETAERHWAAIRVQGSHANISNNLTITRVADRESSGCRAAAATAGLWNGEGDFVFGDVFASGAPNDTPRQAAGAKLLEAATKNKKFTAGDMMTVLRNCDGGICMGQRTTGSMVSIVNPLDSGRPCVHFLTATPDPSLGVFKPFLFSGDATQASALTECVPGAPKESRGHALWKANQAALRSAQLDKHQAALRVVESSGVSEVVGYVREKAPIPDAATLFHECADAELKILQSTTLPN